MKELFKCLVCSALVFVVISVKSGQFQINQWPEIYHILHPFLTVLLFALLKISGNKTQ